MSNPSDPTYAIAKSNPPPQVAPQHAFVAPERGAHLPCWFPLLRLDDGHVVHCGLSRAQHAHHSGVNALWERTDGP